jgi:hypothetical protein
MKNIMKKFWARTKQVAHEIQAWALHVIFVVRLREELIADTSGLKQENEASFRALRQAHATSIESLREEHDASLAELRRSVGEHIAYLQMAKRDCPNVRGEKPSSLI